MTGLFTETFMNAMGILTEEQEAENERICDQLVEVAKSLGYHDLVVYTITAFEPERKAGMGFHATCPTCFAVVQHNHWYRHAATHNAKRPVPATEDVTDTVGS